MSLLELNKYKKKLTANYSDIIINGTYRWPGFFMSLKESKESKDCVDFNPNQVDSKGNKEDKGIILNYDYSNIIIEIKIPDSILKGKKPEILLEENSLAQKLGIGEDNKVCEKGYKNIWYEIPAPKNEATGHDINGTIKIPFRLKDD